MTLEKKKPTYKELESRVAALEKQLEGSGIPAAVDNQRRNKFEYEHIIEFSRDGCAIFNDRGKVLSWNKALENLTGMVKSDVIGRDVWDVQYDLSYEKADKTDFIKSIKNQIRDLKTVQDNSLQRIFEYKILSKGAVKSVEEIIFSLGSGDDIIFLAILRDISEIKMQEAGMRLADEAINHFIDSGIVGIVIATAEGKVLRANDYYLNLIGYSREEFEADLVDWRSITPPEWLHTDEIAIRELREKGICTPYEKEYMRRDGNRVAVFISDALLPGPEEQIAAFILDITERKRAEAALLESEELFSLFMKQSPIYAFIKEVSPTVSKVLKASENYVDMVGIPGSQMVGKTMYDLFPPDFAAKITADDWSVVANGIELKLDEDLNGRHYHTIKYPITHGNRRLLAGYTIDITDRKTGEVEISLKNRELEKAIAEKDKFFSIIAHDLRTPFTAFLGFTRMMVEDLPTLRLDEIQKFALIMRNSATNLYTLLENLLEWSRIQRGIIGFDPSPVLLGRKAAECLVSVMESASKKGIEFNIKIPDDLTVIADGNMLGSILRNLTTNAVKYTPKGGEISLSAKPIGENQAEISVCDNGIGMSKELMDKLFHLDEHSSRKGTDGEASTGLGLIICKDFVNKNGGIIRVESEVGEGSTFSFTLPALHRTPVN